MATMARQKPQKIRRRKRIRAKRRPNPVCPAHGWLMFKGTEHDGVAYFYCPEDGCRCSTKRDEQDD